MSLRALRVRNALFSLIGKLAMAVVLKSDVACGRCGVMQPCEIEFLWGEDNAWHTYRIGASIQWKSSWRQRRAPELGRSIAELDPVWIHGSGATPCHGPQDFLIEIRANRIRGVQALPEIPTKLHGFGLFGVNKDAFYCTFQGPSRAWPLPVTEHDLQWLRGLL